MIGDEWWGTLLLNMLIELKGGGRSAYLTLAFGVLGRTRKDQRKGREGKAPCFVSRADLENRGYTPL